MQNRSQCEKCHVLVSCECELPVLWHVLAHEGSAWPDTKTPLWTRRAIIAREYSIRNALSRRLSLTLCCRLLPRCFCTAFSPRWVMPTMRCVFPLWLYSWSAPFRRGGYCRSCQMLSSSYYVLQTMAVSRVTSVTWCAAEASPWNTCEEVLCRGRLANFYAVGVWIWRWLTCIGLRCDYKMISDLFWCSNFFLTYIFFFFLTLTIFLYFYRMIYNKISDEFTYIMLY